MTPITWQNVRGPSLAEASRPLEVAQRSLGDMFSQFGGLVKNREQIDANNWTAGRTNNTQAFLDQLAQYKTPEALAAAQQSGAINQLRAKFGTQIDAGAVRGAEEARLVSLMGQAKQAGEFKNWQTDEREAPIRDQIKGLLSSGDPAKIVMGTQMLEQNQLRQEAELHALGNTAGWQQKERGEAQLGWGRAATKHNDDLLSSGVQRTVSLGNLDINRGQLGVAQANSRNNKTYQDVQIGMQREDRTNREIERLLGRKNDTIEKFGKTTGYAANSKEGSAQMLAAVKSLPEDAQDLGRILMAKFAATGMPAADAANYIGSATSSYMKNDSWDASTIFKDAVKNAAKNGNQQVKTAALQQSLLVDQLAGIDGQLKALDPRMALPGKVRNKGDFSGGAQVPIDDEYGPVSQAGVDAGIAAFRKNSLPPPVIAPIVKQGNTQWAPMKKAGTFAEAQAAYAANQSKEAARTVSVDGSAQQIAELQRNLTVLRNAKNLTPFAKRSLEEQEAKLRQLTK